MSTWRRTVPPLAAGGGLLAVTGAAAWRFSQRILASPAEVALSLEPLDRDRCTVVAVGDGSVDLRGAGAARAGRWGLRYAGGYGQLGAITEVLDGGVRRAFTVLAGTVPGAGDAALLHTAAWPDDPVSLGLPWEPVTYHSTAGELPAWEFPVEGDAPTTAIFVHGRSGRRSDAFRLLPTVHDAGLPALVISYRNDADAAGVGDGRCRLGDDEWEDLEGAVVHALAAGARDVVLFGYSMGGTIISRFLRTSAHAARVRAVVLDAPVLRWQPVFWAAAEEAGVPAATLPALLPATYRLLRVRAGIDLDRLDTLKHAEELATPILLVHGEADDRVPVRLSDALAERRPDLVTYVRVPDADHTRSWNVDPAGVEAAVRVFLREVLDPRHPGGRRRRGVVARLRRR